MDNQSEERKEHLGVGILVLSNDKTHILLGERMNAYKAGWLGMPGGRIEGSEQINTAAKRELWEEVGITAQQLEYLGVVREWQKTYSFIHFGFVVSAYSGEITNKEKDKCKGWKWYSLDQLPEKIIEGHKGILELYIQRNKGLVDLIEKYQ